MKTHTNNACEYLSGKLGLCILFFVFVVLAPIQAQIHLHTSKFPSNPAPDDWYSDPKRHDLWRWDGKWILVKEYAYQVHACHGFITCVLQGKLTVLNRQGKETMYPERFFCGDSVFLAYTVLSVEAYKPVVGHRLMSDIPGLVFYDQQGDSILGYFNVSADIQQYEIQKMTAWCLPDPQYDAGYARLPYPEIHFWGVFGENGKWLIQPIYDAPFHFKNGIAEVIYYGQKRKINENGEAIAVGKGEVVE